VRVFLLDPGLLNRHGHHYHVDLAIYRECAERGIPVTVLGNRGVEPQIQATMPVQRVFRAPAYPSRDGAKRRSLSRDFDVFNRLIERDLATRVSERPGSDDLILIPTVRDIHLTGMLRWYETLPQPRPRVCMRLLFEPEFRVQPEEESLAVELHRRQLRQWAALPGQRVVLAAERESLASFYSDLSGLPVHPLPMPIRYPGPVDGSAGADGEARHIVFVGEARREKGFALLPQACRRVLDIAPRTRFTLQTSCLFDIGEEQVRDLQSLGPAIRLVRRAMSVEEYDELMLAADLVLVPYDPATYRFRTSQIFLEALGLGKPVVTTQGTWMHEHLARLEAPEMAAESFTVDGLVGTIERLFNAWPEAVATAGRAGAASRRLHNPQAFVEALLERVKDGRA